MKIGDAVRHKKSGKIGIVIENHSKKSKTRTRHYVRVNWMNGEQPWFIAERRLEALS
tara:strand:- start:133 stop:303 length:171 start_codon:yes stop_codon:yes gene_type:complete